METQSVGKDKVHREMDLEMHREITFQPTDANLLSSKITQHEKFLTLVRVFLCPFVGPFPSVGLTLTWIIWGRNLALHITFKSVKSVHDKFTKAGNLTKTFSSEKFIETNNIFAIRGKKPFLFQLRACKQDRQSVHKAYIK